LYISRLEHTVHQTQHDAKKNVVTLVFTKNSGTAQNNTLLSV
jgi:hypothetical protein